MPSKISFRVVHVSGQHDIYKAVELNTHSPVTKGWQSAKFCLYPQDIVIQLDKKARLKKLQLLSHQYLVATKIEFYVGDVPDGLTPSLQSARYTRLGYVALSDNAKTGFKARELKSVHVDAVGMFVKFVIHKNHINKHNLYNQVGLVAINVIGEELDMESNDELLENAADKLLDPALAGLLNRPDYISPLDDLAFDMYQDPEVAQIIRKLEKKKHEAVLQERYEFAKRLKEAMHSLQKVGEKLGKYEVEKRQAVEGEDYERAQLRKLHMDEFRLHEYREIGVHNLLAAHPETENLAPTKGLPSPKLSELPASPRSPSTHRSAPTPYDELPLPAINAGNRDTSEEETALQSQTPYEERPLPANKNKDYDIDVADEDKPIDENPPGTVTGEPEEMTEKDQRSAAMAIDLFQQSTVSKLYSKGWAFREEGLTELLQQMRQVEHSPDKEVAKSHMKAAILLVDRALKDKVYSVFTTAFQVLKVIFTEYVAKHKIPKSETSASAEKTSSTLLQRTGDTSNRIRDAAKSHILEMSNFHEVKPLNAVPHESQKTFKLTVAPRLALSRTEVVEMLYKEHGLQNSGLTVESVMRFATHALRHAAGSVRECAERLIESLYRDVGAPVRDHLPADDAAARRSALYRQLFEAFDRVDGKPSKDDVKRHKQEAEQAKQKEIEALQNQLQNLKDMAAGKTPLNEAAVKDDKPVKHKAKDESPIKSKDRKEKKNKSNVNKPASKVAPPVIEPMPEDDVLLQIDHTCIFCGEKNSQFTEEGLDVHYWKSCPMLKRCTYCKQVVEIAGLTEHLLTECESKVNFQQCARCTEAILKTEYDRHAADKTHPGAEPNKNHCPLCHASAPPGEDGWKEHLMGKDGCRHNPRRPDVVAKQGKGAAPVKGGAARKAAKPAVRR